MSFDPNQIKRYNALDIMKLGYPEGHFLIGPRILPKGARWLLGGATKIGKSWLLANIARNMITGTPLWGNTDWPCEISKVLLVEDEIGPWTTGERLKLVMNGVPEKALSERFFIYSQPRGFSLSDPAACAWLKSQCKEIKPDLVMFDPINKLHYFDDNSSVQMLRLVNVIKDTMGDDVATCISHHYKKPPAAQFRQDYDGLDPYNFNGSARLVNDADLFLTLDRKKGKLVERDDDDSWALDAAFTGLRHGPAPEPFRLLFNENQDGLMRYREAECDPQFKMSRSKKQNDGGLL